jgi:hypothetical protein
MKMLDMREPVMWIFIAAVLVTDGCVRTPKRKAELIRVIRVIRGWEETWWLERMDSDFRKISLTGHGGFQAVVPL